MVLKFHMFSETCPGIPFLKRSSFSSEIFQRISLENLLGKYLRNPIGIASETSSGIHSKFSPGYP